MSQKGFVPLLIVILLAIAALGGGYLVYQQSRTEPVPTPSPQQVVESYYNDYLNCINNHFNNLTGKSPQEDCPYQNGDLSDELVKTLKERTGADPVLCAQNPPLSIKVNPLTFERDSAITTVHTFYKDSEERPIAVTLKNTNGRWIITTIACGKY